jgi:hypothetical protein
LPAYEWPGSEECQIRASLGGSGRAVAALCTLMLIAREIASPERHAIGDLRFRSQRTWVSYSGASKPTRRADGLTPIMPIPGTKPGGESAPVPDLASRPLHRDRLRVLAFDPSRIAPRRIDALRHDALGALLAKRTIGVASCWLPWGSDGSFFAARVAAAAVRVRTECQLAPHAAK